MKPNSRLPCSELKISTTIDQKIDTTKRLNTEIQIKKNRPIHATCSGVAQCSAAPNTRMEAAKKRYDSEMNCLRGKNFTSAENGTFKTSMAINVPVNSHARLFTPPATPIWSRIGRRM